MSLAISYNVPPKILALVSVLSVTGPELAPGFQVSTLCSTACDGKGNRNRSPCLTPCNARDAWISCHLGQPPFLRYPSHEELYTMDCDPPEAPMGCFQYTVLCTMLPTSSASIRMSQVL